MRTCRGHEKNARIAARIKEMTGDSPTGGTAQRWGAPRLFTARSFKSVSLFPPFSPLFSFLSFFLSRRVMSYLFFSHHARQARSVEPCRIIEIR